MILKSSLLSFQGIVIFSVKKITFNVLLKVELDACRLIGAARHEHLDPET